MRVNNKTLNVIIKNMPDNHKAQVKEKRCNSFLYIIMPDNLRIFELKTRYIQCFMQVQLYTLYIYTGVCVYSMNYVLRIHKVRYRARAQDTNTGNQNSCCLKHVLQSPQLKPFSRCDSYFFLYNYRNSLPLNTDDIKLVTSRFLNISLSFLIFQVTKRKVHLPSSSCFNYLKRNHHLVKLKFSPSFRK